MLAQIVTENGVKKIKPLTADIGAGNPVGTIIVVCSNQIPNNYLPLGTQYDTSLYPVLYALLGTDTTPTASALGLPTLTSGQYAIKATSGLPENQQDNVLATINANNSYSTTEHATGTKWIDGKAIYKKTFDLGTLPNNGQTSKTNVLSGIDKIVRIDGMAINSAGSCMSLPYADYYSSSMHVIAVTVYAKKDIEVRSNYNATEFNGYATIYYTKAS